MDGYAGDEGESQTDLKIKRRWFTAPGLPSTFSCRNSCHYWYLPQGIQPSYPDPRTGQINLTNVF